MGNVAYLEMDRVLITYFISSALKILLLSRATSNLVITANIQLPLTILK